MTRVLVVGDVPGVPTLLRHLPQAAVVGIMGASIRPQYHAELQEIAAKLDVPCFIQPTPSDAGYSAFIGHVRALAPDLIIVNSYSMILREDLLACATRGAVNLHGALLPRNRGANPIQWAILGRQTEGGVTLHRMTVGLDEGPILAQARVPIFLDDTWRDVRRRMDAAAEQLLTDHLPRLMQGEVPAVPQDESKATVGRRRRPQDGRFAWKDSLRRIHDLIRALVPPLPPASFVDTDGTERAMPARLTFWELATLKWGTTGGQRLQQAGLRLVPLQASDASLVLEAMAQEASGFDASSYAPVRDVEPTAWMHALQRERSRLLPFVVVDVASGEAIGISHIDRICSCGQRGTAGVYFRRAGPVAQAVGVAILEMLAHVAFDELQLDALDCTLATGGAAVYVKRSNANA